MARTLRPISEKNIAAYDLGPLQWERALSQMEQEWRLQAPAELGGVDYPHTHWLATVRPDGRPHVVPVGAAWDEGTFYFTSGDGTQKSRNLAWSPNCVVTLAARDLDIAVEGAARKVTDETTLRRLAEVFGSAGWGPPEVRDGAFHYDYSAPSAGPPPWYLYELTPHKVIAVATGEPFGATVWHVERT